MITRHDLYGIPWIDLENPTTDEIHAIIDGFNINETHPIELVHPSLRAKVDRHDDYLFFVLHFPDHPAQKANGSIEIDFVVHKNFIITTRYIPIDTLLVFEKKHTLVEKDKNTQIHGGIIFGLMINDLYDGLIDELSLIKKDIADLENKIFSDSNENISKGLVGMHRKLLDCKSALRFHHEILTSFAEATTNLFGSDYDRTSNLIMHRYYHLTTILDSSREIVYELRETYDNLLAQRTNEIMRTLTLMSFMTFPLALLVAIATFPGAPHQIHTEKGFYILVGSIVFIGIMMLTYFKKNKWL